MSLLVLVAATPAAVANDECAPSPRCAKVSTDVVGNPTPALEHRTFYVYGDAAACNPPGAGRCAGHPGPRIVGLVYEETNGASGLQRQPTQEIKTPDALVLL